MAVDNSIPPTVPAGNPNDPAFQYIDTIEYKKMVTKIKDLCSVMQEWNSKSVATRRLRYVEVDIEGERKAGRLQPDELYIPMHIIDKNIRREQSSYVQYVAQSPRAVCLTDMQTPAAETSLVETDVSKRLRYEGWQIPIFQCIDGFQQDGYGIMEVVYDESKPGHVAHEFVQLGDFGYIADTRNIQDCEMLGRNYYFSRTKLLSLAKNPESGWNATEIMRVIEGQPTSNFSDSVVDNKDKSLYCFTKVTFRLRGIVYVAWANESKCNDWAKPPVPLFLGRRQADNTPLGKMKSMFTGVPSTKEQYETDYPYILFPYLISENDTVSQLHGRAFLDEDVQEGASSLMSSYVTAHRRAAQPYFSKDTDDPNADLMLQKNVYFAAGALINAKIKQFQLTAPNAEVMNSIQALIASNQDETAQINFAAMNRKDSRKTAEEIKASTQAASALSTVQVVLFSNALREMYSKMFRIIQNRVNAGLILDVDQQVKPLYQRQYLVRPAGDVDVIERQQTIQMMQQAWPVLQNTPCNIAFMCDLLSKMFPEQAAKYISIINQAQQQQQSQQARMMNQAVNTAKQVAGGIIKLSEHPEMFSDTGRIHAFPIVQEAAKELKPLIQANGQNK